MTVRYQLLKYLVAMPVLHAAFRIEVHGREHIPRDGGVIIACNHISAIDSLFLPFVVPRHVTFLAKREFTAGRGFGAAFKRGFMSAMGQLAIERGGGSARTRRRTRGRRAGRSRA
jgi:1-acyl-sn-glycerol-3-phosphate acyltransferase